MYYLNEIEEICYEPEHLEEVIEEIKKRFNHYFNLYLETEAGNKISAEKLIEIAAAVTVCQQRRYPFTVTFLSFNHWAAAFNSFVYRVKYF
jgi:hypothetical protein